MGIIKLWMRIEKSAIWLLIYIHKIFINRTQNIWEYKEHLNYFTYPIFIIKTDELCVEMELTNCNVLYHHQWHLHSFVIALIILFIKVIVIIIFITISIILSSSWSKVSSWNVISQRSCYQWLTVAFSYSLGFKPVFVYVEACCGFLT